MKRDLLLAHYEREVYSMKGKLKKSVKRNEIVFSSNRSFFIRKHETKKENGRGEEEEEETREKNRKGEIGLERIQYTVKIME